MDAVEEECVYLAPHPVCPPCECNAIELTKRLEPAHGKVQGHLTLHGRKFGPIGASL